MKKLLFILLFFQSSAIAQDYFHYNLTIENGLPSNTVFDIHLSQEGFLYIGTSRGVVRYDGKKVEELFTGDYKIAITGFEEDANGNVFFLTFSGGVWESGADSVRHIKGMTDLKFPTISILNKKELIISSNNGYYSYDAVTKKVREHALPTANDQKQSQAVIMASVANGVIIKLNDALFRIDSTHKIWPIRRDFDSYIFCVDWDGRTAVIGRSKGNAALTLFEIIDDKVVHLRTIPEVEITDLLAVESYNRRLYLLTRNGYKYFVSPTADLVQESNFSKNSISKIIKNKQNGLYISTLNEGVKIMPNTKVKVAKDFNIFSGVDNLLVHGGIFYFTANDNRCHTLEPKGTLANMMLNTDTDAKLQSDGNLLFNSPKQKFLFQPKLNKVSQVFIDYGVRDLSYYPAEKKAIISNRRTLSVTYDDLVAYSKAKEKRTSKKSEVKSYGIFTKNKKRRGRIMLMEGSSSVHYYNAKNGSLYASVGDKYYHFYADGTTQILQDKNGPIDAAEIVPSTDGVFYLNGRAGIYKLVNDSVVATLDYAQGLVDINWKRIKTQGDTLLLIGDNIIQIYSERTGPIVTYSTSDFLPTSAVIDVAIYENKLFISTSKGVYELPLTKIKKPKPRAFIRYLRAGNVRWLAGKSIPFLENNLTFKIAGNSIVNRGEFHYEYNLQGTGSDKWVAQDASIDNIRFSSLTEGSYKLRLKVVTTDGMESEVVEYPFRINPPFTRSLLFYILCFLFVLGVLGLIFWLRLRALRRASEFDRQVKQSEITAIKAQMNPHFVFNALNSIQNWVLLNDVEKSNLYLGKFSDLVRKTLETSEENEVPLIKEIEMIKLYLDLENLRFGDEIEIDFDVKISKANQEAMRIPAMLIQPYIENVFKHGLLHKKGAKELLVLFEVRDEKLFCQITDNGVGIKRSGELNKRNKKYKSFSTVANRKRIDLLNDMFDNEIELITENAYPDQIDCGTRVTIWLPISMD